MLLKEVQIHTFIYKFNIILARQPNGRVKNQHYNSH